MTGTKVFKGFFRYLDSNGSPVVANAVQTRYLAAIGSIPSVTTLYERDGSTWTDYSSSYLEESQQIYPVEEKVSQIVTPTASKLTDFFDGRLKNLTIEVSFQEGR